GSGVRDTGEERRRYGIEERRGDDVQKQAHGRSPVGTVNFGLDVRRRSDRCVLRFFQRLITTCAGLIALYLPLFAVISKASGTFSIPCRMWVIVGLSRTRPAATRCTVCSRCPRVLMSGKRYRKLRSRSVSMSISRGCPNHETPMILPPERTASTACVTVFCPASPCFGLPPA